MPNIIDRIAQLEERIDVPAFRTGDTLRVHVKIVEGDKERVQVFEGIVIKQNRGGAGATFTVRKISYGVGVERIFPLHSPLIEKIEVKGRGKVRRAKLYYLRELTGRKAKIRERRVAVPEEGTAATVTIEEVEVAPVEEPDAAATEAAAPEAPAAEAQETPANE